MKSSNILILTLALMLTSCSSIMDNFPIVSPVQIYTIPVIPKTKLPAPIANPNLSLPPPMDMTAEEASYLLEACDAYSSGSYSKEELQATFPDLTRSSACDWVVRGWWIQGWFNVESKLSLGGSYSQQLRDRIIFLEGIIKDYEDISDKQEEAIRAIR